MQSILSTSEPEFGLLGALPEDVWVKIFTYLNPPALVSIALLNTHFSYLIRSYNFLGSWSSIFPAKARSIQIPWHDIADVHKSTFRIPHNSGLCISDYPKCADDFDCAASPHKARTADDFFSDSRPSIQILTNVFSRVRGYHRKVWRCRYFGDRICRIWHIPWDGPYSSCEYRVFQYPPGLLSPPPFASWGDFLMWKESSRKPLKVVRVNGMIMFATDFSIRKSILHRCGQWLRSATRKGKRKPEWYDIIDSEADTHEENPLTPPIIDLATTKRKAEQLHLFNVFTGQEYIIPFTLIFDAVKFMVFDNPIIYPQDVIENTMCSQFLLLFEVHTPGQTLFMVWNVESNKPKWKEIATGAVCDQEYRVKHLLFGNALMGYLAKSTHAQTDKYMYIIRDLDKGTVTQTFSLDGYRDPLSTTEFDCAFTSFVFIVSEPQTFVDNYMRSPPHTFVTAPFHIYSIATGQKLYTLECPMNYPQGFRSPVIPWFQRTDESERYWVFLCPDLLSENGDIVNKIYVWDVVSQEWTLLASRCVEKDMTTIVYTENGRMKMAKVDADTPNRFEHEEKILSKFRWKRLPTMKEAIKLSLPLFDSVP